MSNRNVTSGVIMCSAKSGSSIHARGLAITEMVVITTAIVGIIGFAASFVCITQASPKAGRFNQLEIVDDQGRTRILLGNNPRNKLFGAYLYNAEGVAVGQFGMEDAGRPFLLMKTADSSAACQLIMDEDGACRLEFLSPSIEVGESSGVRACIGVGSLPKTAPMATRDPGFLEILGARGGEIKKQ